jgi:hypothetical protein
MIQRTARHPHPGQQRPGVSVNPRPFAFPSWVSQPSLTGDGRRAPGLRFGDPRVQALAGALANSLCAVTGITNKCLRALMTGLLGNPYGINQASYTLGRLARNGLIARVPHRDLYTLTPTTCDSRSLHQGPRPAAAPAHGQ